VGTRPARVDGRIGAQDVVVGQDVAIAQPLDAFRVRPQVGDVRADLGLRKDHQSARNRPERSQLSREHHRPNAEAYVPVAALLQAAVLVVDCRESRVLKSAGFRNVQVAAGCALDEALGPDSRD
jgi:hypothetical protein